MDNSPCSLADVLRPDVERGDPDSIRMLYRHVLRRLEDNETLPPKDLLLLLKQLAPKPETDKQEQYSDVYRKLERIQTEKRCSLYEATQDYHTWLQEQDACTLSDLEKMIRVKRFPDAYNQIRKSGLYPPRMKWRSKRNREKKK